MRPEVTLDLVAQHLSLARRWRCLVCAELRHRLEPTPAQLVAYFMLRRAFHRWRANAVRPPPRRRVISWRRQLHDMEAPILLG